MSKPIEYGTTIGFRISKKVQQSAIDRLNLMRIKEGRQFSSQIANIFFEALQSQTGRSNETLNIDLPQSLTKEQREWLSNPVTKQMLSQWLVQFVNAASTGELAPFTTPQPIRTNNSDPVPSSTKQEEKFEEQEIQKPAVDQSEINFYNNMLNFSFDD